MTHPISGSTCNPNNNELKPFENRGNDETDIIFYKCLSLAFALNPFLFCSSLLLVLGKLGSIEQEKCKTKG
jgi:hypothetical protein